MTRTNNTSESSVIQCQWWPFKQRLQRREDWVSTFCSGSFRLCTPPTLQIRVLRVFLVFTESGFVWPSMAGLSWSHGYGFAKLECPARTYPRKRRRDIPHLNRKKREHIFSVKPFISFSDMSVHSVWCAVFCVWRVSVCFEFWVLLLNLWVFTPFDVCAEIFEFMWNDGLCWEK